jgi:hypothetical protein
MSNLPEGWDTYDPTDHDRSAEPGYQAAAESREVVYDDHQLQPLSQTVSR